MVAGVTVTAQVLDQLGPALFRAQAISVYPFAESVDRTTALLASGGVSLLSYGGRPSTLVVAVLITAMWAGIVVAGLALARHADDEPPVQRASRAAVVTATVALGVVGLAAAAAALAFTAEWYGHLNLFGGGSREADLVAFIAAVSAVGCIVSLSMASVLLEAHAAARTCATTAAR